MVSREANRGWLASVSQVGAWLVSTALAIVDMLFIREAILALLSWFSVAEQEAYRRRGGLGQDIFTQFGITAFDSVMILVIGLAAVVAVILIENYFRKGRAKGVLYKRIGKVFLVQFGIIVGSIIIRELVALILQART